MADNYVFKNLIWKFAGLNLILSAIGKWYTFQLLSGTHFDYHIHTKWYTFRLPYTREVTGTNKSLQLTMVTSSGLVHNAGWQSINNEVDVDDLFHA